MPTGLTFSFVVSEDVTAEFTLFGTDLVLSAEQEILSGQITGIEMLFDYSTTLEGSGFMDATVYDARLSPIDVTINVAPVAIDMFYLTTVLSFGQAAQELPDYDHRGIVLLDEVGVNPLATTAYSDHVTVGGDGRLITTHKGDDLVRLQDNAAAMEILLGKGHDQAFGGQGADIIKGGRGQDSLFGGAGDDFIYGGVGNDILDGGAGRDILKGGAGNDVLISSSGADVMRGGAGTDVLVSSGEDDRLMGGAETDAFVFIFGGPEQASDFTSTIRDFQHGEDLLWMGGTGNSTHDSDVALALFLNNAVQDGNHVVLQDGDWVLTIQNATLADFIVDDFVDGANGIGFYQWADSLA